jgi:hypothetical protein
VRDAARSRLATFVALAAFAVPAAVTPASATTSQFALCSAMTEADATKAFGEPAITKEQASDQCWYESSNGLKIANLIQRVGPVKPWRAGYRNKFWSPNSYGDEGYTGKQLDSIVWRDGNKQYEVNVVYSTKGNPRRAVQQLAKAAYARLSK